MSQAIPASAPARISATPSARDLPLPSLHLLNAQRYQASEDAVVAFLRALGSDRMSEARALIAPDFEWFGRGDLAFENRGLPGWKVGELHNLGEQLASLGHLDPDFLGGPPPSDGSSVWLARLELDADHLFVGVIVAGTGHIERVFDPAALAATAAEARSALKVARSSSQTDEES